MSDEEDKPGINDVEDKSEVNDEEDKENEENAKDDKSETSEEGKVKKPMARHIYEETFGEEFGGEDSYYPLIPPSDLDMLMGQAESKGMVETLQSSEPVEFEVPLEEVASSEDVEEEGEKEEIPDMESKEIVLDKVEATDKPSLESITSSEYGMRITEYFMQPREKTPSELQFETDYREVIEEKMKKIIRPLEPDEEKEKKPLQERKPIEKKKLLITEIDVSGLYPQPKLVESEVSFAFDEDEEGDRGGRGVQTEAEIIMELLRRGLVQDPDNIFSKNVKDMIQKVRQVVEEIVTIFRRGVPMDIVQKVNDSLAIFKPNLKLNLISILKDQLQSMRVLPAEEEEEGKPSEQTEAVSRRIKKRVKIKGVKKIEETVTEEPEEYSEEEEVEQVYVKEKSSLTLLKPVAKVALPGTLKVEEKKEEVIIAYEKIDWNEYLSESERKLNEDPILRAEMDKYIQEKKAELDKEQNLLMEKQEKRLRYIKPRDANEKIRNLNLIVTMKFLLNSGDTFTCAYKYFMTFREIKQDLTKIFKVPCEVFIIYRDDKEVDDESSAYDLVPEIEPFDTVTFRLVTLDNDRWPLKSDLLDIPVPDIITCTVETGKDHKGVSEYKEVVVEIENRKIKKPFVGGYRDCATGIEYHHAFSQSAPHPPKLPWEKRNTRDTQTTFTREKLIDTTSHKATQMARRDYYVSTETDKIITAKPYVDYEQWRKNQDLEGKVRTIQKYIRAMIIRRFIKKMSEEYALRKCREIEEEKKRVLERENRIKMNIINMTYPKTKADFNMLYALVEKWWKSQIERISSLKTEAPRKAEFCAVLEKEIKLLEAIEVHRIAVSKEQKRIKALNFMEKVATPVTWTGYRGLTVKMDTLKTQRARELKELFQSLSRHDLEYQDRIELLIAVKHALRMNYTRLTEELTGLINQECELLIRGVKAKDLEYLRQRIEHLFNEYFKDPLFNPEAAKYDPTFHKEPLKNTVFCKSCHRSKFIKNFSANARDKTIDVCSSCQWVHNIAIPRVDLNPYSYILKMVRKDEQKRNCYSSCAFILQDEDMRFLVQNIWKNKSAVSENLNLMDLRMPRWDKQKDWTPWNCILLTEAEARAHLKTSPTDNYEPQLIGEIVTKHELAKRHFQQLFSTSTRIRDSGKWANTVDVKDYSGPPLTADLWDIKPSECLRLKKTGALYEVHETKRKDDGYVHEWPLGNDTMKSKMEIDPTTQKDAGYYECQADNQYAIDRRGFRTDYVIYTY
ncbi:hypothetical protein RUM44_000155 [Polyplax serrata]|uniref:IQ motif and ubiquitin-like domain-containing protein n=1 Tax=Polyplax serrata TaxID=468196 RepID=A0ABR1B4M3_POLSC